MQPVYGQAMRGMSAYGDRAGVNGAEGQDRAMGDFNRSVYGNAGEQYGSQAVQRNAAGMGLQASGNNMAALADFMRNNRAQNYTQFTNLAAPYNQMALSSAGGMAQQQGALANTAMQDAQARSGLYTNAHQALAQAGGNALAAGDQTRQQVMNLGMQLGQMGLSGISALAGGMGGFGGMGGGMGGALGSAMNTLGSAFKPQATNGGYFSGSGPMLPGYGGSQLSVPGGYY
jgi:hypothetical protein